MKTSVRAISVAVGLFCAAAAFAQVPAPAGVSVPAAKAAATTAATNAANTAVGNATTSATTAATNAATNAANKVVGAPAAAPAPAPAPAAPAAKVEAAKTAAAGVAAGGGAGKVWVNAKSKVYHCEGTKSYGTTKNGEYMTEAEAKAKGNHGVKGKSCAK